MNSGIFFSRPNPLVATKEPARMLTIELSGIILKYLQLVDQACIVKLKSLCLSVI